MSKDVNCKHCGNPVTVDAFGALAQHVFCANKNERAMNAKVIINGKSVDFDAAVNLMDDELRETLHLTVTDYDQDDPSSYQNFINAYCAAHVETFGEDFEVG